AESLGHALHVRVDDDALGRVERDTEHDVRRLPPDAGQLDQIGEALWYLTAVTLDQQPREPADALALLVVHAEPARAQDLDHVFQIRLRERRRGRILLEQVRRHLVDEHVGRLRAEYGRDEELKRALVIELAVRFGMNLAKLRERNRRHLLRLRL